MAFATKYRIVTRSVIGVLWNVDIELDGYSGTVEEFKGNGTPINIKYVDNAEEKITSIRASSATFSFVSDTFELQDIIDDNDTKYRVSLYNVNADLSTTLQWRGFLSTDDCSEPYISGPRVFTLTASDGLAFLKDEPYKWADGTSGKDAYGKRTLLNVLADCLQYTYTELAISIQCNLYEEVIAEFLELPPFKYNKVHTKLFLYADGGPKNMYEVIECLMLTFDCTIFQQFGQWHINRTPDYFYAPAVNNTTTYSWPALTESQGTQTWIASRFTNFNPVQAGHVLSFIKPNDYSKITHNYIIPEIPDNPIWTRGSVLSGTPGANATVTYEIDFWPYQYGLPTVPTSAGTAYRVEKYDAEGNIDENYVELPVSIIGSEERLINENGIQVDEGDEFNVSGECRMLTDVGYAVGAPAVRIRLIGISGQHYTWDPTVPEWQLTLTSGVGASAFSATYGSGDDSTVWLSFNLEMSAFPEDGDLYIWLCNFDTGDTTPVNFRKLQVSIELFLNGVTENFKGEYSQSDNNLTSRNKDERIIKLGDSPKRLFASALWRASDDTELTSGWGRKDETLDDRLIDLNSQDLQKSASRVCKALEGEYKGITFDSGKLLGVGNLFSISDLTWVATNMEIDIINDTFSATLQELIDTTKTMATIDTEFKYIFDERS